MEHFLFNMISSVTQNCNDFIGWSIISEGIKVIPGTVQSCSAILKAKESLAIAPGGVYEAQFGSHVDYSLMWKERVGFARVALMSSDETVFLSLFSAF